MEDDDSQLNRETATRVVFQSLTINRAPLTAIPSMSCSPALLTVRFAEIFLAYDLGGRFWGGTRTGSVGSLVSVTRSTYRR